MLKILVLLSAYNGKKFITEQIDSILDQKNVDVHLLIRNDGSSDTTREILEKYQTQYCNQIQVIHGNNEGFSKSFYELVVLSGDYDLYAFSDQDDVWYKDKLDSAINALKLSDRIDVDIPSVYFCNAMLVNEKLEPISIMFNKSIYLPEHKIERLMENLALGCTMVFNKKARDLFLKGKPEILEYHDAWLYTVCSYLGKVVYDETPHILYRQHDGNLVGSKPGFKKLWKHRIKKLKSKTHYREYIAKEMLRNFESILTESEIKEIRLVSEYRTSLIMYIRFLFSSTVKMASYKKKFWLKMHILTRNV